MRDPESILGRFANPRFAWAAGLIAVAAAVALLWQFGLESGAPIGRAATSRPAAGSTPLEALPPPPETLSPLELAPLTHDQARARNAAVPIAEPDPAPARPFRLAGSPLDQARAIDCLAIAAMAEAGGSDEGQRAVMQVVLNRVRHPAFVRTVCGTVFQGSERVTGCQFTFTCDGALRRRYSDDAWAAARVRAQEALGGRVYAPVGLATHYHTDWVYPYWSSELAKIARVETHLFFRWPGFWGSADAARIAYGGNEPAIAALADLPSHSPLPGEEAELLAQAELGTAEPAAGPGEVVVRHPEGGAFFVHLSTASAPAALSWGRELCSSEAPCRVMGWTDPTAVPAGYPLSSPARAKLTFSYVREGSADEIVFYDCKHFTQVPQDSCLPRSLRG
jgi:spore germination cell wall hydrolase CwlJ-like protein